MTDQNTKPDPRAEAKAKLLSAQAARRTEISQRAALVGKEFTPKDPAGDSGKIISFIPNKIMEGKIADAFVVNFGHENHDPIVFVEDFNNQFNIKQ